MTVKKMATSMTAAAAAMLLLAGCGAGEADQTTETPGPTVYSQDDFINEAYESQKGITVQATEVLSPTKYVVEYSAPPRGDEESDVYEGTLILELVPSEFRSYQFAQEGECGYEETLTRLNKVMNEDGLGFRAHKGELSGGGRFAPLINEGYTFYIGPQEASDYFSTDKTNQRDGVSLWGLCPDTFGR